MKSILYPMLARKELLGPVGERGRSGSSYAGGGIAALEDGARGLDSSSYGNDATAEENRDICCFTVILCMNYPLVRSTTLSTQVISSSASRNYFLL